MVECVQTTDYKLQSSKYNSHFQPLFPLVTLPAFGESTSEKSTKNEQTDLNIQKAEIQNIQNPPTTTVTTSEVEFYFAQE